MSVAECPYCNNLVDADDQFPEGFKQDEKLEIVCDNPKCGLYFGAIGYWEMVFTGEHALSESERKK